MDNNLKLFIQDHRINILDDNKRAYKYKPVPPRFFQHPEDYNIMTAAGAIQYETERMYTIEVAESELTRIADFESEVFNNMKTQGHYRLFENLMEQKALEKDLRNRYQAVKKAYEHYSLMLTMAESGEM